MLEEVVAHTTAVGQVNRRSVLHEVVIIIAQALAVHSIVGRAERTSDTVAQLFQTLEMTARHEVVVEAIAGVIVKVGNILAVIYGIVIDYHRELGVMECQLREILAEVGERGIFDEVRHNPTPGNAGALSAFFVSLA